MGAPRKLTEEAEAEVVDLYKQGDVSIAELGRRYGMAPTGIRGVLVRRGAILRPVGSHKQLHVETERIIALRRKKYSWVQIGRIVGMSPSGASMRYRTAMAKKKGRGT